MKFEIKKFGSMRTPDGGGYSFDLYIDGAKAAFVCQEGNGGCTMVQWYDRVHGKSALEDKFAAHVAALPPEVIPETAEQWEKDLYPGGTRAIDTDTFLAGLADDYENARRIKRLCRTKTLYRLPNDKPGTFWEVRKPFSPDLKARLLAKHPQAVFVNETLSL